MRLANGIHLGYCTNIHRGETWDETFAGLRDFTLAVRERVAGGEPYGIGLRLGFEAAQALRDTRRRTEFRRWLDANDCYVFTINGFPYGKFHGTRVKEQVYLPDWTTEERADYTKLLFEILAELVPEGGEGSVSTLPGTFKEFITDEDAQASRIIDHLASTCAHVEMLRRWGRRDLHLGLEPEPLGWFETSAETVRFFERFRNRWGDRFDEVLGVNYDTCHLAVEFEKPEKALGALRAAGIRISKIHVSSALKLQPTKGALDRLRSFDENVYLHQVVMRMADGSLERFRDLGPALAHAEAAAGDGACGDEWRVHFHVPVHAQPGLGFGDTRDHVEGVLDQVGASPALCRHFEIETYTWEVLPPELRSPSVVDQIVREYEWTLAEFARRGLSAGAAGTADVAGAGA